MICVRTNYSTGEVVTEVSSLPYDQFTIYSGPRDRRWWIQVVEMASLDVTSMMNRLLMNLHLLDDDMIKLQWGLFAFIAGKIWGWGTLCLLPERMVRANSMFSSVDRVFQRIQVYKDDGTLKETYMIACVSLQETVYSLFLGKLYELERFNTCIQSVSYICHDRILHNNKMDYLKEIADGLVNKCLLKW